MFSDKKPPVAPPRPQRKWQLMQEGVLVGAYPEELLAAKIRNGDVLQGSIRPVGDQGWRDLKSHPVFAAALREAAQTVSLRRT